MEKEKFTLITSKVLTFRGKTLLFNCSLSQIEKTKMF